MSTLRRAWTGLAAPLRDAVLYGASLGWAKGLSMLMLPLLTAMLTPADFGRIELLSSAAEIGALFAGAGLVDTAYRFASGGGPAGRRAAAEILCLAALIATIGVALALVFAPALARAMPLPVTANQIALLGVAVALEALIAVPLAWMRMHGRAGRYAATTALRTTAQAGLVAVLVIAGWGVSGVLAGGAIAAAGAAGLLALGQVRECGVVFKPAGWGRFLGYGMPLAAGGLASFVLGTADRWLLAGAVPAASLGLYALAAKISLIAALLTQPFELWWYPRRIALLSAPGGLEQSARTVTTGIVLTVLAAAGAAAGGPLLIRLLTPVAYHPAAAYIPWLAVALALQSLGSLVNVGCYHRETGARPMMVNGIAAAVALAAYLLLIPAHGVWGAVAATVLAQAVRFALFFVLSQRAVRVPLRLRPLLMPIAASVLAVLSAQTATGSLGAIVPVLCLVAAAGSAVMSGALPLPFALVRRGMPARAW